ncbi:hypothetical protein NDA18_001794 [Ustilago nuda]|nr:hypothetical protein NDA18_001794 [Ustilago nuda]
MYAARVQDTSDPSAVEAYFDRFRSQPGNQETITVIECIAKDWVFATSQNGWTNNELALHWLKDCFDKHTKQRAQGKYWLLILDGHGSHITAEFIQQAWDSHIQAFTKEVDKFAGTNLSIIEETPTTPSTPEEAKKMLAQMYAIIDQDQEEQQALLASNHRQGRIWMKKESVVTGQGTTPK